MHSLVVQRKCIVPLLAPTYWKVVIWVDGKLEYEQRLPSEALASEWLEWYLWNFVKGRTRSTSPPFARPVLSPDDMYPL